jgi:hypothetical protein
MKSLAHLLQKQLSPDIRKKVTASQALEMINKFLAESFGEKTAELAQAIHLKDKRLTIACLNPTVAQEIKFRESELISKINNFFAEQVIEKVSYLS